MILGSIPRVFDMLSSAMQLSGSKMAAKSPINPKWLPLLGFFGMKFKKCIEFLSFRSGLI